MKKFLLIQCVVTIFLLSGFSSIRVSDIETAVIDKDFKAAEQLAKDYIAQNPDDKEVDQARYYLGLSKLYLNEYPAAREIFETLIAHASDERLKDNAALGIVDSFYMEGNYKGAIDKARALLKEKKGRRYCGWASSTWSAIFFISRTRCAVTGFWPSVGRREKFIM